MKEIILVVEDKVEEQIIAKTTVHENNKKIIIASTLEKAEAFIQKFKDRLWGIMTDLHFPINETQSETSANGITVVITALSHDIPCVVCTDDVAHGARYLVITLKCLEKLTTKSIPIATSKDWTAAMNKLTELVERI